MSPWASSASPLPQWIPGRCYRRNGTALVREKTAEGEPLVGCCGCAHRGTAADWLGPRQLTGRGGDRLGRVGRLEFYLTTDRPKDYHGVQWDCLFNTEARLKAAPATQHGRLWQR
jgi:hypothetical protein